MIPKKIHYCWFGYSKKTKLIKDCIASWKFFLPEFEIIEWNESNSDLSHPFVQNAYKEKKWAFVSDYIRLIKLYEFGGIYLDTDMMLLKNIDNFLSDNCFFGTEDSKHISAGIIGTSKNNEFILKCILQYDLLVKNNNSFSDITIPIIITKVFRVENNFQEEIINCVEKNGVKIYSSDYFYPLAYENKKDNSNYFNYIKPNSVAVHLWSASWVEFSEFYYFSNKQYLLGINKMLKIMFKEKKVSLKYLRKIASCIKQSRQINS